MIVVARFLSHTSPAFAAYLAEAIEQAMNGGVAAADLMLLQMMLKAIGGAP